MSNPDGTSRIASIATVAAVVIAAVALFFNARAVNEAARAADAVTEQARIAAAALADAKTSGAEALRLTRESNEHAYRLL